MDDINEEKPKAKNAAAVLLGRLGGLKGGVARALKLSPEKRKEIAKLGADARWRKKDVVKYEKEEGGTAEEGVINA